MNFDCRMAVVLFGRRYVAKISAPSNADHLPSFALHDTGHVIGSILLGLVDAHYGYMLRPVGGMKALYKALDSDKEPKWEMATTKRERAIFAKKPFVTCGVALPSRKKARAVLKEFIKRHKDKVFTHGKKGKRQISRALRAITKDLKV